MAFFSPNCPPSFLSLSLTFSEKLYPCVLNWEIAIFYFHISSVDTGAVQSRVAVRESYCSLSAGGNPSIWKRIPHFSFMQRPLVLLLQVSWLCSLCLGVHGLILKSSVGSFQALWQLFPSFFLRFRSVHCLLYPDTPWCPNPQRLWRPAKDRMITRLLDATVLWRTTGNKEFWLRLGLWS